MHSVRIIRNAVQTNAATRHVPTQAQSIPAAMADTKAQAVCTYENAYVFIIKIELILCGPSH